MRAINGLAAECIEPSVPVGNDTITLQRGLTSEEAQQRIKTSGPNTMPRYFRSSVTHVDRRIMGAGFVDNGSRDRA